MWYVIQTRTGNEHRIVEELKRVLPPRSYQEFLIPLFEDVTRTSEKIKINYRSLFPGYILVNTDTPEDVMIGRKRVQIPEFSKMLGTEGPEEDKYYAHVDSADMDFLDSILNNGIMTVSYAEITNGTKIKKVIGPLAKYASKISKIELRRRRAIVETKVFGKARRIKFGLWTKEDPKIPWIEETLKNQAESVYASYDFDIGIHAGDRVRDITGMYEEYEFVVEKVNPRRKSLTAKIMMFGEYRDIELMLDQVEKLE